jgi:hypothetical protein
MNAKQAKKLRWYARSQEVLMPPPVVNEKGVSSMLLVYEHPKTWTDRAGNEQTFINRTVQYNPRTSGKGLYKALKGKNARIRDSIERTRIVCQVRVAEVLAARQRAADAEMAKAQSGAVDVASPL